MKVISLNSSKSHTNMIHQICKRFWDNCYIVRPPIKWFKLKFILLNSRLKVNAIQILFIKFVNIFGYSLYCQTANAKALQMFSSSSFLSPWNIVWLDWPLLTLTFDPLLNPYISAFPCLLILVLTHWFPRHLVVLIIL